MGSNNSSQSPPDRPSSRKKSKDSGKNSDKNLIRYKDYEFWKILPRQTKKFKEMEPMDVLTKAQAIQVVTTNPDIDPNWKLLLEEKFATANEITKNLFLSGFFGLNREDLDRNGIQFIINATTSMPFFKEFKYRTLRVPVVDTRGDDISPFLDHTADAIHELLTDHKKVIVHCEAGVSRSAALVMAYLIKHERRTLRNAFSLVVSKRPVARPNTSFLYALMKFEKVHLHSESTIMIVVKKNKKIMEMPNWLFYDHPKKFEGEFNGGKTNEASHIRADQMTIDLDADPDIMRKNRPAILGGTYVSPTRVKAASPPQAVRAQVSKSTNSLNSTDSTQT